MMELDKMIDYPGLGWFYLFLHLDGENGGGAIHPLATEVGSRFVFASLWTSARRKGARMSV